MRKVVQRAKFEIGHGDVGIIARGREHRKSLDVNVGDVHFTRGSVRANRMGKSVDDEVGVAASLVGLTRDIGADRDGVIHHLAHLLERIKADVVHAATQILRVARQRDKGYAMLFNKFFEALRRGKFDRMSASHQAERKRKERLNVATRTVGEDGDIHVLFRIVDFQFRA